METPDGYPYLKMTCITEREQYVVAEERYDIYYEAHPIVIDFRNIIPLYWYRYKVKNPDTGDLEICVVMSFIDAVHGTTHDIMIADTFPKVDKLLREWIEYSNEINNEAGTD